MPIQIYSFILDLGLKALLKMLKNDFKDEHVKMIATAEDITEEMLDEGHDHDHDSDVRMNMIILRSY